MPPTNPLELLFVLIAGHAVGDFALQGDWLASNKNRHIRDHFPAEERKGMLVIWPHLLTAHCLHHALIVYLITHNIKVSLAEFFIHWVTDFGKNEKWYDFHTDQFIHIGFKILWTALITMNLI